MFGVAQASQGNRPRARLHLRCTHTQRIPALIVGEDRHEVRSRRRPAFAGQVAVSSRASTTKGAPGLDRQIGDNTGEPL